MGQGYFPTLFPTFPWSSRALNASKHSKNFRGGLKINLSSSKTHPSAWKPCLAAPALRGGCTVNKCLKSGGAAAGCARDVGMLQEPGSSFPEELG